MEGCDSSKFSTHSEFLFHAFDYSHSIFPAKGQDLGVYTNGTDINGAPSDIAD